MFRLEIAANSNDIKDFHFSQPSPMATSYNGALVELSGIAEEDISALWRSHCPAAAEVDRTIPISLRGCLKGRLIGEAPPPGFLDVNILYLGGVFFIFFMYKRALCRVSFDVSVAVSAFMKGLRLVVF